MYKKDKINQLVHHSPAIEGLGRRLRISSKISIDAISSSIIQIPHILELSFNFFTDLIEIRSTRSRNRSNRITKPSSNEDC